ncbi:hypothetical protein BsWGS_17322 [Bradybaena similaris]
MADQTQALSIASKLRCLQENKGHLLSSIERYVDGIVAAANSWLEGGASRDGFVLLSQKIDSALEILSERFLELTEPAANKPPTPMPKKRAVSFRVNRCSYPSSEQPDLTAQTTEAATVSSPSSSQASKTCEAPDEKTLKSVLARLAVAEEAMWSFRKNAEKVAEKQRNVDQQLKELWSKINEADKNGSSRLDTEAEKEKSGPQDAIEKKQKTSIQSPEKQSHSESNLEFQTQKEAILEAKLEDLITDVLEAVVKQQFQARLEASIADCTSKSSTLETAVQSLTEEMRSNTQNIKVIMKGQDENNTQFRNLKDSFKEMKATSSKWTNYLNSNVSMNPLLTNSSK